MIETYDEYIKWQKSIRGEQRELYYSCLDFEDEYFQDMRFRNKEWYTEITGGRDIPVSIEERYVRVCIDETSDIEGCYDPVEKTITIDKEHISDKATILHEMLHFYCSELYDLRIYLYEILLLYYYEKLSGKIPDLKDIIVDHADSHKLDRLEENNGLHDILFLLKSLDLDLQCGYELGTIYGY